MRRGLSWEEWDIGAEFGNPERTITETDMACKIVSAALQVFLLKRQPGRVTQT